MTLGQIFIRFLKENGIFYDYMRKEKLYSQVYNWKKIINDNIKFKEAFYLRHGLQTMFFDLCAYMPCFLGPSESPQRRKFYRINKKWKEHIKSFKLQHNIKVGDIIRIRLVWASYIVDKLSDDGIILAHRANKSESLKTKFHFFDIKELLNPDTTQKKIFINVYSNKNDIIHGKVNGDYNEIQL